jgi:hypothetical protein
VCRVGVADLPAHLELHTKQEVVFALLTQQQRGGAAATADSSTNESWAQPMLSSNPGPPAQRRTVAQPAAALQIRKTLNNVSIVNNISSAGLPANCLQSLAASSSLVIPSTVHHMGSAAPLSLLCTSGGGGAGAGGAGLFPVNMITGFASTQLLLPQVNGPTLLVNVPNNYVAYQQQQQQAAATHAGGTTFLFPAAAGGGMFASASFGHFAAAHQSPLNHHQLLLQPAPVVSSSSSTPATAAAGIAVVSCVSPLPPSPSVVAAASGTAPAPPVAGLAPAPATFPSPPTEPANRSSESGGATGAVAVQRNPEETTETDGAASWSARAPCFSRHRPEAVAAAVRSQAAAAAASSSRQRDNSCSTVYVNVNALSQPEVETQPEAARQQSVISWPDMVGGPASSSSQTSSRRGDVAAAGSSSTPPPQLSSPCPQLSSSSPQLSSSPSPSFPRLLPAAACGGGSGEAEVAEAASCRASASSVIVSPGWTGEALHTTTIR